MAPLDPNAVSRSNVPPIAQFSGQVLLITGLSAHILYSIRHASKSLPPSSATRAQEPVRRRNAAIFSVLALISLGSAATFSVAWRILSYFEWAEGVQHDAPGTLWTGWYGTGEDGVGRWRLGDWWSDVDIIENADAIILAAPEAFLYLYQHFCGITAAAIFFGVEGRRRNLAPVTIASFVILSTLGSLGFALNMFFVLMLYTPLALHDDHSTRHDALFTPKPALLYVPVVGSILLQQFLPYFIARRSDLVVLRSAYFVVPLFLAFAPQIVPPTLGNRYPTKAAAHRSYVSAFYVLGVSSLLLQWYQFTFSFFVNTPPAQNSVYDLFMNAIGKQEKRPNRLLTGLSNTAQQLKRISGHPAITITGNDIFLTAAGLLAWTLLRQLDVNDVLHNSVLSFLAPAKAEKHVTFKEKAEETVEKVEEDIPPVSPKKRGRPKKNAIANGVSSTPTASSAGSLRRSTRRRTNNPYVDSDAEDTYEPTSQTSKEVTQTESDGSAATDGLLAGGESTALVLLLGFTSGLGQLAASVLGAEVTGGD